jgi:hypothetical protein
LDAARAWYEDNVNTDPVQELDHRATVESVQLEPAPVFVPLAAVTAPNPVLHNDTELDEFYDDDPGTPEPVPTPARVVPIKRKPEPVPVQEPLRRAAERRPAAKSRASNRASTRPARKPASSSRPRHAASSNSLNASIRAWCVDNGFKLGYNNHIPIEGLRAYRKAHPAQSRAS